MSYPIIRIPIEVQNIKETLPESPKKPKKPLPPEREYPLEPEKPEKPSGYFIAYLISIVLIIVGMLVITHEPFWGILLGGGGLLFFVNLVKNAPESSKEFDRKLFDYNAHYSKYINEILNLDKNFAYRVANYNNEDLPKYEKEFNEYLRKKEIIESTDYINEYHFNKLREYFSDSAIPRQVESNVNFNKGITEDLFFNYLKESFYDEVFRNVGIVEFGYNGLPYVPDFVVHVKYLNLYIDIEIDEPYIGADGTPIHFKYGQDEHRNNFFTQKKWIVIRFAEIQIVKHPDLCVKLIKEIVEYLLGEIHLNISEIVNTVPNTNQWTEREANRLAYIKARNKYLDKDLIEKVELEKKELERKFFELYKKEHDDLPF